ncbi:MAG TPA: acyltransferase [Bryobacteraceae bacterium]|nr:acyltransferase [Bryobacteraceae bacterium]
MQRIPTLDGWRAVAILLVVAHHVGRSLGNESTVVWRGVAGVDVFFAISGLLITSQLLEDGNLRRFYIRRAFRILPAAALYLVVVLLLGLTNGADFRHCLLISRNYSLGTLYTGHFWSLSLEEQFYLVWPITLMLSGKRARVLALVCILAVCVWRPIVWWHWGAGYEHTDQRCDGLLWGCLAAFWLRSAKFGIGRVPSAACMAAAIAVWGVRLFLPFMPALLAVGVLGTVQSPCWAFSRLLDSKVLVWIGQRSYGIYLWQQLLIFAPVRIPMAVRLVLVFLWPAVLYRYFETPLRQMGRRIAKGIGRQEHVREAQACPTPSLFRI